MKPNFFLGIDTSNYTTSVAVCRGGDVVANLKAPLPVKAGECGLRQSDALFAHIKNLPLLSEKLREVLEGNVPSAIGVSSRPRNLEGSYMPCFLGGVSAASMVASALGVPLFTFSHQCGHLRAALYSSGKGDLRRGTFGAFHVSGGTTEMLLVSPTDDGFHADIIGGTKDLNAGQLVDRIGVMLGLNFPCGIALEALAKENSKKVPRRKIKTESGFVHLSGVENMARKLYEETEDKPLCAAFVLRYLADAVIAMSKDLRASHGEALPIVYAGGVMSNRLIQEAVKSELSETFFAEPLFSADNAAGIALLTEEKYTAT